VPAAVVVVVAAAAVVVDDDDDDDDDDALLNIKRRTLLLMLATFSIESLFVAGVGGEATVGGMAGVVEADIDVRRRGVPPVLLPMPLLPPGLLLPAMPVLW